MGGPLHRSSNKPAIYTTSGSSACACAHATHKDTDPQTHVIAVVALECMTVTRRDFGNGGLYSIGYALCFYVCGFHGAVCLRAIL